MITIDMQGQSCPIPVVEAKKTLKQPGVTGVSVLVDNRIAVENLQKMAKGLGSYFSYKEPGDSEYTFNLKLISSTGS